MQFCVHHCTMGIGAWKWNSRNARDNSFSVSLQVRLFHIEKRNSDAAACDCTPSLSRFSSS